MPFYSSGSTNYGSELQHKLQFADIVAAAAAATATWTSIAATAVVIKGLSVKLICIPSPDLSKQLQVSLDTLFFKSSEKDAAKIAAKQVKMLGVRDPLQHR